MRYAKLMKVAAVPVDLPSLLFAIPRNPAVAVGLPLAVGFASGFITRSSVKEWYRPLVKPPASSPDSLSPRHVGSPSFLGAGRAASDRVSHCVDYSVCVHGVSFIQYLPEEQAHARGS